MSYCWHMEEWKTFVAEVVKLTEVVESAKAKLTPEEIQAIKEVGIV